MNDSRNNGAMLLEEQMKQVFQTMNSLRKRKELCDVILNVDRRQIFAHRIVLASFSPYFYAMFTTDLAEKRQSSVTLKAIDAHSVELLVEFAYTAQIEISDSNVQNLMSASSIFQVGAVQKACCEFLESRLDPRNCIGIMSFAESYNCVNLADRAKDYCFSYFNEVSKQEEYLNLDKEQVSYFIGRDELFVQSEDEVLAALLRWLKRDLKSRVKHIQDLMQNIRLAFVSYKALEALKLIIENFRKSCSDYREHLAVVLKDIKRPSKKSSVHKRCPPALTVIYTAGGYLQETLNVLECFDPKTQTWTSLAPLPTPRSGLGAAFVGNMLYVIGGRSGNVDTDVVDHYNPMTNCWVTAPSLTVPRYRVGVTVHDDIIYAIGGGNGTVYHKSVERFDSNDQTWKLVAPMSCARIGLSVTVLKDKIYACGGFNGTCRLKSVEIYDPIVNTWQLVAPMLLARSGAAIAALKECFYIIGGYNGETQQNSVEQYDCQTNTWTLVRPMHFRRSALSAVTFEGKVFALGGFDGNKFHGAVEVYTPEGDKWDLLSVSSTARSGAGVAVGWKPKDR